MSFSVMRMLISTGRDPLTTRLLRFPFIQSQAVNGAVLERDLSRIGACGLSGRFSTILAGIALPNDASVRLHEKFGFRKVAPFPRSRPQIRSMGRCWILAA